MMFVQPLKLPLCIPSGAVAKNLGFYLAALKANSNKITELSNSPRFELKAASFLYTIKRNKSVITSFELMSLS